MREGRIEKIKSQKETKELEFFRKQIKDLVERERKFKEKKEPFDPRLLMIGPDALTDDDLKIFQKYQEGTWQLGDFLAYTEQVTEELEKLSKKRTKEASTISNSRDNFRDFIAGKAKLKFPGEESAETIAKT